MIPYKPSIYRKEALAKLSSPEDLDRLMQITTLRAWLVLGGFGCVLLIALLWGFFGRLTTTVDQTGELMTATSPASGGVPLEALVYLSLSDAQQVRTALIDRAPSRSKFRRILRPVRNTAICWDTSVGCGFCQHRDAIRAALKNDGSADGLISSGDVFEVRLQLTPGAARGYTWSTAQTPAFDLVSGTPCQVTIIVKDERPVDQFFRARHSDTTRSPLPRGAGS